MITNWGGWEVAGTGIAWTVTFALLLVGLVGCVIPVIPAHLLVMLAAISHRLMLRENSGVEWWTFAVLALLLIGSQTLELMSGAAGTKWFGGTKWGAVGALVGSLVGIFFGFIGILIGPLIGAFAFELLFAKRSLKPAAKSGAGSFVGTLTGMGIKIAVGVTMIGYFLIDVVWI